MSSENLALHWPDALDTAGFLARHWQREALWMPQALPGFNSPLAPDDLAGLALEEDVASRLLIERPDGRHDIEYGPFDESRFAELDGQRFSLLIPDVDKHLPALAEYLRAFDFIPSWRMDDLMISYAPDGGSVGAHVDAYDVFLLQATGTREWLIDTRPDADPTPDPDSGVRQLARFDASATRVMHPGDILYLPPGVPHHGIARGDNCTTWSIGFRAPSVGQLSLGIAERMADALPDTPLPDPVMQANPDGEISAASISAYRDAWRQAMDLDDARFSEFLGQVLTANGDSEEPQALTANERLHTAPWTRVAWAGDGDEVRLFVNGESLACSRALAAAVCNHDGVVRDDWQSADLALLDQLVDEGALVKRS